MPLMTTNMVVFDLADLRARVATHLEWAESKNR